MRKIILLVLVLSNTISYSQKELWGNNDNQITIDYSNPSTPIQIPYNGNITKYDINGQNGTIVHVFDGINGKLPKGKLFQASNGKLYGTTNAGGNTFFTTPEGTGVLYEYDLILNKYTVVYYFEEYPGDPPKNGVIEPIVGKLYGSIGYKVFSYDLNTLQFTFVDNIFTGASVNNELMKASNGLLYGTTASIISCQGTANSVVNGTITKVNTTTNYLDVAYYLNCNFYDGMNSNSRSTDILIEYQTGKLYGTVQGGSFAANTLNGLIFEFNINTNTFIKKIDFDGDNLGSFPNCMVNAGNGKLYGVCLNGGTNIYTDPISGIDYTSHWGTLFEYNVTTNTITKLHDFGSQTNPPNSFSGMHPKSLMKASTGFYFGVSDNGLFKFNPADNSVIMPTPIGCTTCPPGVVNAFVTESLIEICRKPSYQEILVNSFTVATGANFTYDVQNTNASSYQWLLGGATVVGQTTGVLNITNATTANAGNYTCVMTNECGTTTTAPLTVNVSNLGVNNVDISLNGIIKLYPNPTNTFINIELPKNINVTINEVKINDMLGKEIFYKKENKNKIDVSALAKGIYIVSIKTNYGSWNGKFVKE